jgi:hypothetical protein
LEVRQGTGDPHTLQTVWQEGQFGEIIDCYKNSLQNIGNLKRAQNEEAF